MMFMTLPDPISLRVILIDGDAGRRDFFGGMLVDRGFILAGAFATPRHAAEAAVPADLVIFHVTDWSDDATTAVSALREGLDLPLMALVDVVRRAGIERLISAGANQVVPVGMQSDRILVGAISAMAGRALRDRETKNLTRMHDRGVGRSTRDRDLAHDVIRLVRVPRVHQHEQVAQPHRLDDRGGLRSRRPARDGLPREPLHAARAHQRGGHRAEHHGGAAPGHARPRGGALTGRVDHSAGIR